MSSTTFVPETELDDDCDCCGDFPALEGRSICGDCLARFREVCPDFEILDCDEYHHQQSLPR